ncbi:hypothetical protein MTYM_01318 [Methylococcales bacterium]|nr:hypothetical protein MTYM_01318 [Methylococcales bacterium]
MKLKTKKMINPKTIKTARGYRLKPETHALISKIQALMKSDQDRAISAACTLLHDELKKNITLIIK